IYSFIGAAPELLNSRPAARVVKLEQSHRLPARVAALAARIIGRNRDRVAKRVLPRPGADGEIHRAAHLGELPLTNGESWMVLFRNWRFADPLAAELEETGIPYRIQGEARYTPWSDRGPLRAARAVYRLSAPGGSVTLSELTALTDKSRVTTKERPGAWVYGAKSRIEALAGERPADRVTLAELPELGLTEWGFDRLALRNLEVLAGGVSARDLKAWQAARESGQWDRILAGASPQVVLSTIHGVKGQQADNVAALAACTRMPARNLQDPTRCEEEVRLAYVAVTRAYRRFYTLDGGSMPFGQPYEVFE
ncbi:MAG: 3'-5' exonuclease, partial [Actinomycetota bacterium]|nr:3'-5' exonuclease [Actinomycetota bacterium]